MTLGACVLIQHWAMLGCVGVIIGLGANPPKLTVPGANLVGIALIDAKCPDTFIKEKKVNAYRAKQWLPNQILEYATKAADLATCAEITASPLP